MKNTNRITKINFDKSLRSNIQKNLRVRNYIVSALLSITLISIILSAIINLQIIKGSLYGTYAEQIGVAEAKIRPERGNFYDRNGKELTSNTPIYSLIVNIAKFLKLDKSSQDFFLQEVANITRNKYEDLAKLVINQNQSFEIVLVKNIDFETAGKVAEYIKEKYNFSYLSQLSRRVYYYPYEFSHIIGYVQGASTVDLENSYYDPSDSVGKYKLESSKETELRGLKSMEINIDGQIISRKGEPGSDVTLTIDSNWQSKLYQIIASQSDYYNGAGAAGVIIDSNDGRILAAVSYPGFDSNSFVSGITQDQYNGLLNDRRRPLLDKVVALQASPGSTFKLITSYALLEDGIINRYSNYYSNRCIKLGPSDFCEYGRFFYGNMNVVRALYKSSNLFFCVNSLDLVSKMGFQEIYNKAKLFNIGELTGVDIPGELKGNMDSEQYRKEVLGLDWFDGDTCNAVIGQGAVLATPIQLAVAAAAIENGGTLLSPYVIEHITSPIGENTYTGQREVIRNIPFQSETLSLIKEGLEGNVQNPEGIVRYSLFGIPGNPRVKTGTAEAYEYLNGENIYRTHGWIVGSFDFEGRAYSFAFHINFGASGSNTSNIARKFIYCLYNNFSPGCENI